VSALSRYAVKLAVLQYPEAFGLRYEDVNPILAYTLVMAEAGEEIIDHESILDDFVVECERTVNSKVSLVLNDLIEMPDIPEDRRKHGDDTRESRRDGKSGGNGRDSSKKKGGKKK